MFFKTVYHNLCVKNMTKDRKNNDFSIHCHHIIPRHMGGSDLSENLTYLSVREHIIAHFLLWKIYGHINDLRSMHMLGAKLSTEYRRKIGIYCRDNKIGFHKASQDQRQKWSRKGLESQRINNIPNSFYYWSTEEGRKKRSSMGGKVSGKKQAELGLGFHQYKTNPELHRQWSSLGGKAHIGKKCMYKPGDISFKRVVSEQIEEYIKQGYILGSPISRKGQKTNKPSPKRKNITDGNTIFSSLKEASIKYNITSSAIHHRLKSSKFSNWKYI